MTRQDWPHTDAEWCAYFRKLDEKFGTHPRSPLHHDNRCPLHKSKPGTRQV